MKRIKSPRATFGILILPVRASTLAIGSGLAIAGLLLASPAEAGDISYTPVNPSFGGNALNSSHLLSTADSQNKPKKKDQKRAEEKASDPMLQFTSTLQSRLLSSVSDKIADAIYGDNPANSGTFVVDNTTVQFTRVGGNVQLSISDGIRITNVTVPAK
jgi:curli production assembly/transport component CsgF